MAERSAILRFLRNAGLTVEAIAWLWAARLSLWVLPFRIVRRRWLYRKSADLGLDEITAIRHIRRVRKALALAQRFVPKADCFPQALAAHRLLARRGILTEVRLGARRMPTGFEAHAWLEWDGRIVIGGHRNADAEAFQPFEPLPEGGPK